jgi:hypothetical protein
MTLYAGAVQGVFKSTDSGSSWSSMNAGLEVTSVTALAVEQETPNRLYVGTVQGDGHRSEGRVLVFERGSGCAGDCNADGQVNIDELVLGVEIAQGAASADACAAFDPSGGPIHIELVISAVDNALYGCPQAATQ